MTTNPSPATDQQQAVQADAWPVSSRFRPVDVTFVVAVPR